MKLFSVSMIRNESPILEPFLDQLSEFFDYNYIVDHQSTDSSVDIIKARKLDKHIILSLSSQGYPQSQVSTFLARKILSEGQCDYLFFLDADEFLSFPTRQDLEGWLDEHSRHDVLLMPWLNICPTILDGSNIFSGQFLKAPPSPIFYKIILRGDVITKVPSLTIDQGNHGVTHLGGTKLREYTDPDTPLFHIPIQSKLQYAIKVANGQQRLLLDRVNLSVGKGLHWIGMAGRLATNAPTDDFLTRQALGYGDSEYKSEPEQLGFAFPYVRTAYKERENFALSAIAALARDNITLDDADCKSFTISNDDGSLLWTSRDNQNIAAPSDPPVVLSKCDQSVYLPPESLSESYDKLISPLFKLPTKLPPTAWEGHIPFLFVLFRLLRPRSYLELGVFGGASVIAAASAAQFYSPTATVTGIDTWEGDPHNGAYDGTGLFQELTHYLEDTFSNTRLIRSLFSSARPEFRAGSIDILHIDGFHTYEAVKNDFFEWLPIVAPNGVILFHDISVLERDFGVHRVWKELKNKFATIEFHHSYGLGVLFMDETDTRIKPLLELFQNEQASTLYQSLVADIAATLPERMAKSDLAESRNALAESKNALFDYDIRVKQDYQLFRSIVNSRILRISGPLSRAWRMAKRRLDEIDPGQS